MSTIIEQTTHRTRPKRSMVTLLVGALLAVACCVLATPAAAETRELYANSLCEYPVRILVLHADSASGYRPQGWYAFPPYHESRLSSRGGGVLRQVVGYNLYIYAETAQGAGVPRLTWGGEDARTQFQGVTYSLRKIPLSVNQSGQLEFDLTCQ